jgi:hypothetical protein
MPDLEERIRHGLDHLAERPDPARVLERVGSRKRRLRAVRRAQAVALVVAVLAGVAIGSYALARTFGIGTGRTTPNASVTPPPSAKPTPTAHPSRHPSPSPSTAPSGSLALCLDQTADIVVGSQQGAAGTISTVWKITNTAQTPCRTFGYPGMDFHTSSGWLNVQVHRGGIANVNQSPQSLVVQPGGTVYFVSDWSDATTQAGPCRQFDRVKVTLPDNTISAVVTASGCVSPDAVNVGPVMSSPPPS